MQLTPLPPMPSVWISWAVGISGVITFISLFLPRVLSHPIVSRMQSAIAIVFCFFIGLFLFEYARMNLALGQFHIPIYGSVWLDRTLLARILGYIVLFWSVVIMLGSLAAIPLALFSWWKK